MVRKVVLEDNNGEELIPYTSLATAQSAGRVSPDGTTLTVNASGVLSVNGATSTEIGYLSGVTSAIQTQINNCVHLSGDETIAGNKTFTGNHIIPTVAVSDNSQKGVNTAYINTKFRVMDEADLPANRDANTFYFVRE